MRHPYGSALARIGHPPIPAGPAHPPALAWLGHPVTVVATIVLLINDHVLKALWPGLVTGKLSDVAGLLVAPPLLALVRVPALGATIATGTGFVLVKTTATGAALASQAWTLFAGPSRVLADPTDLVALPALGLAWLVSRRCRADHAVRRARTLIIVPVALIAVTATSQEPPSPSALSISVDGDAITVLPDQGLPWEKAVSRDGGRTWSVSPAPTSPPTSAPSPRPSPATRACLPDDPRHCYRLAPPRLVVDESLDGGRSWHTVWGVSEGREGVLRRHNDDNHKWPWQGSTAVAVQLVPDGHVVVAANGNDGIAVRDARGAWRRLGFSDEGFSADTAIPLRSPDIDLTTEYLVGLFAGLLALMAGLSAARRNGPQVSALSVTAYVLALIGFAVSVSYRSSLVAPLLILFGLACALTAVVLTVAAAVRARVSVRAALTLAAIVACTSSSICWIFSGWVSGTPDDYSTAVLSAWLAGGAGVAASVMVGWTDGRNAPGGPAA
ncbi:hypothetical protein [Streptosporangium canum]|uniref:hypothetical protein n=1 Tax=Streptosporangium canum TaxID=324952 RepID=UPI00344899E9